MTGGQGKNYTDYEWYFRLSFLMRMKNEALVRSNNDSDAEYFPDSTYCNPVQIKTCRRFLVIITNISHF